MNNIIGQRRRVSWGSGVDQTAHSGIGIEAVLIVTGNRGAGGWLCGSNRSAENLKARNVDRGGTGRPWVSLTENNWLRDGTVTGKPGTLLNALICLLIDGLDRSRIIVVIVERPIARHVID